MDEYLRDLERRAATGDLEALNQYRRRALRLNLIPEPVIRVLAGYGYQPAQDIIPRYQWPNSTSAAFDLLFHGIPHNAHTAAVIRYRVLDAAYDRMFDLSDVLDAIRLINTIGVAEASSWEFRLQKRNLFDIIENALTLLKEMTQEEYYDDLCIRSQRDYSNRDQSGRDPFGSFYPKDPLVLQHSNAKKDCEAIGHLIRAFMQRDLYIPAHLDRAIFTLGDAVAPKLVGFEGVHNLDQMHHGIHYFLDGMDYSWSNEAHIEAIFSYYLI